MAGITALTVIEKPGSEALACPSLTAMLMAGYDPASLLPGVPLIVPLLASKAAQSGRLTMLKVSVSPSASLAVGVKL